MTQSSQENYKTLQKTTKNALIMEFSVQNYTNKLNQHSATPYYYC
jgi:hypothetical protein